MLSSLKPCSNYIQLAKSCLNCDRIYTIPSLSKATLFYPNLGPIIKTDEPIKPSNNLEKKKRKILIISYKYILLDKLEQIVKFSNSQGNTYSEQHKSMKPTTAMPLNLRQLIGKRKERDSKFGRTAWIWQFAYKMCFSYVIYGHKIMATIWYTISIWAVIYMYLIYN